MWMLYWVGLNVSHVLAQTVGSTTSAGDLEIKNPLACGEAVDCAQSILGGLTILAAPVVAVMVLVGGFQIMSSGGSEEKVKKGKDTILYAVAGYAIILLATGIATVIQDVVNTGGGGGGAPAATCPGDPSCPECSQPSPPPYCVPPGP